MKLVPLPARYLLIHSELPFNVFDAGARLLLAAGQSIDGPVREHLLRRELFVEAAQWAAWGARLEPDAGQAKLPPAGGARCPSLGQEWAELAVALESALREPGADGAWVQEALAVRLRARRLAQAAPEGSLCHLVHAGGMHSDRYSCHQALRCMLIAGECARVLGWSPAQVQSLESAALTMNVAILRLQDLLAQRHAGISPTLRAQLGRHPREGARMLAAAGVTDPVWVGAVAMHHDVPRPDDPALVQLSPAQQAARLLRRIDIFCAKLSRRGHRAPLSGLDAVRQSCLGRDGKPDEIGTALLRAVGMYPPGTFVRLANGEYAQVLARGSRAPAPCVASFIDTQGMLAARPWLRDTTRPMFAVRSAVSAARLPERPDPEQLLALLR